MIETPELPAIASSPLSVILIVDAMNAEAETAFGDWVGYLNGLDRDYEILLASESVDTALDALAGRCARARVIPTSANGFGSALREGLKAAQHPLVCYTTCDRQYRPQDLKHLFKLIDKTHLVCGRRVYAAGTKRRPWRDWAFRLLVRAVFAVRLKDVECRFLLARRSIFPRIPIQSEGPFAHVEILAKSNFLGQIMADAPVEYRSPASDAGDNSQCRSDFRRVYKHPDFGPVNVPEFETAKTASTS